ncbi:hypothetical protein PoB_006659300 [Plakobranchus ocellatus]|uniref:Uncharacterized protein n=1 Tax=Plakobranchus ocellatus TaxID=259542 RepID=A0AAV4D7Q4_9GAST|nr:hypothetical protein PoB_006659300 [Plakobranchus ocellatus]
MSGRNARFNGTKLRKVVRISSTAHPRPATPTVPPIPDPRRPHRRACQDKAATAIRTFKDTARLIQPFPNRHPSGYLWRETWLLEDSSPDPALKAGKEEIREGGSVNRCRGSING